MGFFANKFNIKPFKEAEVDGQDMNDPNDQANDYTADDAGNQADQNAEQPPQDNNEEQPQDDNQENMDQQMMQDDDPPPTDYTDDAGSDDEYDDQGGGSDNGGGGNNPSMEEDQPVDELKKQEEELYGNLSDEQLNIKHKELKNQFLNMYDMVTDIIERISNAAISENNIPVVKYISDQLSNMRTMLTDYMDSVYAGKSYIENSIAYNRFLAVLNGINKMLEEMGEFEDK